MITDDKDLQEAKEQNQKSRQGGSFSSSSSSDYGAQEAKQLNSQSLNSGGSSSTSSSSNSSSNFSATGMGTPDEESKKLNQQSRQNKSK